MVCNSLLLSGSYFKESRLLATAAAPISTKETEENSTSEEKIKQLEVFTTARDQTVQGIPHSFGVEEIPHARIAAVGFFRYICLQGWCIALSLFTAHLIKEEIF